jgi:hypothetical protein
VRKSLTVPELINDKYQAMNYMAMANRTFYILN